MCNMQTFEERCNIARERSEINTIAAILRVAGQEAENRD